MQKTKISTFSVLKHFSSPDAFNAEIRVYRSNLPMCPNLLNVKAPLWINLQKLEGIAYLNQAEGFDPVALAKLIASFHLNFMEDELTLCHWDNSPGNILACGERYYLIDFEESRYEYPEHDLSHLMLFWLEAFEETVFQQKKNAFLKAYQTQIPLSEERWTEAVNSSLERFIQRRKQHKKRLSPVFKEPDVVIKALSL